MYRRTLCFAALLALPGTILNSGDTPLERATLRGLKAVNVVIDRIDSRLPREGVTSSELQTWVEGKLKDAGMLVSGDATEFVGLQITAVRGSRGPYGLAFTLGLYQPVVLSRDSKIRSVTKTWEVDTILLSEPKTLRQASLESVDDLVGQFIAAWRSVNSAEPR